MNIGGWLAGGAALTAVLTALFVAYKGWKDRVEQAAQRPFTAGRVAIDEAELALQLKDRRLADTAAELEQARAVNAAQAAQNAAQAAQISDLYAQLGRTTAKNSELEETARQAKVREEADRARITALEQQVDGLLKQLGLGHGP